MTNAASEDAQFLQQQPGYLLRRAYQNYVAHFMRTTSLFQVSPQQFAALSALHELGPSTQRRVAQHIAMQPGNLHSMLKRMVKHSLISMHADPLDNRRSVITLTPEGQHVITGIGVPNLQANNALLNPLSAQEQTIFMQLLSKVAMTQP